MQTPNPMISLDIWQEQLAQTHRIPLWTENMQIHYAWQHYMPDPVQISMADQKIHVAFFFPLNRSLAEQLD